MAVEYVERCVEEGEEGFGARLRGAGARKDDTMYGDEGR